MHVRAAHPAGCLLRLLCKLVEFGQKQRLAPLALFNL